mgnify:CR=1 FL=1
MNENEGCAVVKGEMVDCLSTIRLVAALAARAATTRPIDAGSSHLAPTGVEPGGRERRLLREDVSVWLNQC